METQVATHATLPRRILVGLDGSAGSARALAWAIDLAKPLDAEIVAVYVALSPLSLRDRLRARPRRAPSGLAG